MKFNRKTMWVAAVLALVAMQASAQILTADQVKKTAPSSFFFAGQSAAVQTRNAVGLKNSAGKFVLAGLVDTAGYSTAIAQKYQGFLITETQLRFDGAILDAGAYGFGFKDGKFIVMNVASTDLFSIASQNDNQLKH